jgi:hypothetical protein
MAHEQLRPIVTNLNNDSGHIISFPRPPQERTNKHAKAYFHLVTDPWFGTETKQLFTWLLWQSRHDVAAVQSPAALDQLIVAIEAKAGHTVSGGDGILVDALEISFNGGDHCNPESLVQFPKTIPVFAAASVMAATKAVKHFDTIIELKTFDDKAENPLWRMLHPGILPDWLSFFELRSAGLVAFCICFVTSADAAAGNELILFASHGLPARNPPVNALVHRATPEVTTLAMLTPLKTYFTFGQQFVYGAEDNLAIYRQTKARYWIRMSDGANTFTGPLSWVSKDILQSTLEPALEKEKKKVDEVKERPNFVTIPNGGQLVLA